MKRLITYHTDRLSLLALGTKLNPFQALAFCAVALGIGWSFSLAATPEDSAATAHAKSSEALPWSQIGAKAGADYQGDGLAVSPTAGGRGCAAFSNGSKARPRTKACG